MAVAAIQPMNELKSLWKSVKGKLPPYYEVEGSLSYKEADTDGMPYIIVNAAAIEVDRVTFDRVQVGDMVRVRYTRDAKAISIDRITEGARQNGSDVTPR